MESKSTDEKSSELIREAINIHGELHLDKMRTEALVKWLRANEHHQEEMLKHLLSLCEVLRPVVGEDLYHKMILNFK